MKTWIKKKRMPICRDINISAKCDVDLSVSEFAMIKGVPYGLDSEGGPQLGDNCTKKCFFLFSTLGSSFVKPNQSWELPLITRFTLIVKRTNPLSKHVCKTKIHMYFRRAGRE